MHCISNSVSLYTYNDNVYNNLLIWKTTTTATTILTTTTVTSRFYWKHCNYTIPTTTTATTAPTTCNNHSNPGVFVVRFANRRIKAFCVLLQCLIINSNHILTIKTTSLHKQSSLFSVSLDQLPVVFMAVWLINYHHLDMLWLLAVNATRSTEVI